MIKKQDKVQVDNTITNQLGKETTINGDIETFGNIRVEGKIFGDLKTKSKAVFAPSSHIQGSIHAQNAEISGEVVGTVTVVDLLTLKSTAVIKGDIVTNKLVVESGASFNGSCKMGESVGEIQLGNGEKAKLNGQSEKRAFARAK